MSEIFNIVIKSATESTNHETWVLNIAMAVMTVIGSIFLFCFSLPLFFTTLRTRDTSQINFKMWIIYIAATFFLGIPSLVNSLMVLSGETTELDKVNMIPLLVIGIANIVSLLSAITLVILKAINRAKAKKEGISETEYCILHNPVLKKQTEKLIKLEVANISEINESNDMSLNENN